MVNIVILSNDNTLNERLNKAFNEFVSHLISFKITNLNDVYEDVSNAHLLLVNPKMEGLKLKRLPKDCAYAWFTEDIEFQQTHIAYVYIYQSIFEISQSLMKIIENYQQGNIQKSDFFQNTKIISFFSCGGNISSWNIGEVFTYHKAYNEKKSILHMILSPIGNIQILNNYIDSNIYLEDIENCTDNLSLKDVDIIKGFKDIKHSINFNSQQFNDIIKKIKKYEYDYIIIDGDFNYINIIKEILEQSNSIILIIDNSEQSIQNFEKINDFTFEMDFKINQKIKIICNKNKCDNNLKIDNSIYSEKLLFTIENTENNNNIIDIAKQISCINL